MKHALRLSCGHLDGVGSGYVASGRFSSQVDWRRSVRLMSRIAVTALTIRWLGTAIGLGAEVAGKTLF